jgi:hypothetical protein
MPAPKAVSPTAANFSNLPIGVKIDNTVTAAPIPCIIEPIDSVNSPNAFAIFFKKPFSFDTPITLEELREEWSDFRPPQCYYYLKEMEINLVKTMAKCDILGLSEKFKIYQTELLS